VPTSPTVPNEACGVPGDKHGVVGRRVRKVNTRVMGSESVNQWA
jgi:hypothetical protein